MKAEMQRQNLRGRRPVRADRRLRTDDGAVRTQSAILDKGIAKPNVRASIGSSGATHV